VIKREESIFTGLHLGLASWGGKETSFEELKCFSFPEIRHSRRMGKWGWTRNYGTVVMVIVDRIELYNGKVGSNLSCRNMKIG